MGMDALLPLTLSWRGLKISPRQAYELIALNVKAQDDYLHTLGLTPPEGWRQQGQRELDWCYHNHAKVFPFWHPDYPKSFFQMSRPPLLLTGMGLDGYGVDAPKPSGQLAVVGSRNLSFPAAKWMETEFSRFLQREKPVVVSGGARGADQLAHTLAIRNFCPTVCVLPSGLADIYPANLRRIERELFQTGGGHLSPFAPSQKMFKGHFSFRNELIALMTAGVFVVEARERSGSILTAKKCLQYGRELMILPSAPTLATAGGLMLIRDGAQVAVKAEDVIVFYRQLHFHHLDPLANAEAKTQNIGRPSGDCQGDNLLLGQCSEGGVQNPIDHND